MDPHRFDAFARALATGATRRDFMGVVAAGGGVLGSLRAVHKTSGTARFAQNDGEATVGPGNGCADEIECPPGKTFSPETCTCLCDVDCPPNFAPDPNSCNCYCTLGDFYQCPRDDQVYDDGRCLCVCKIEDCPGDAVLDPETCLCSCPNDIACAEGETLDPTTCECVCNRTCQPPFILNQRRCECECDRVCAPNFELDEDACVCVCAETCREPFELNPDTCACECHRVCDQDGFVLNEDDCQCYCGVTDCEPGKILDETACRCVCLADECVEPKVLDEETCDCVCPPARCAAPRVQDPETCLCVCPPDIDCPQDRVVDPETCACVCRPGTTLCDDRCVGPCLPTEVLSDDCQCEPIVCPPDRVLTCICACPPDFAECKEQCLPACLPNQVFDDSCRCVCRPNISCAEGWELDPETCECVCAVTDCPARRRLDPDLCRCVCDVDVCPQGKELDEETCRCVCPPNIACPSGEVLDQTTCACACQPGSLLDTVSVPCTSGAAVTSTFSLQAGVHYTLRASGTCTIGPSTDTSTIDGADAEFAFDPADLTNTANTRDRCGPAGGSVEFGIGIDDPTIDSTKTPKWGAYRANHVYTIDYIGKGAPIDLNFHDCIYEDNAGSLTVKIYCRGAGPGGDPGTGGTSSPPCNNECPPNQVATDVCQCVCAEGIICSQGKEVDPATCECVCPDTACGEGKRLDPETCQCVCATDVACSDGETLDPETCTCRCEPGSLIERITVPCSGASVSSALTLQAGVNYTLRASGVCSSNPTAGLDAEYAFDPSDTTNTKYADKCGAGYGFAEFGIAIDDPIVDSTKTPKWGPYTPTHIYSIDFVGKGAPISLNYHDCIPEDNDGSLTVEILCPGSGGGGTSSSG